MEFDKSVAHYERMHFQVKQERFPPSVPSNESEATSNYSLFRLPYEVRVEIFRYLLCPPYINAYVWNAPWWISAKGGFQCPATVELRTPPLMPKHGTQRLLAPSRMGFDQEFKIQYEKVTIESPHTALLRVCRMLHQETSKILYGETLWNVHCYGPFSRTYTPTTPVAPSSYLKMIRKIQLNVYYNLNGIILPSVEETHEFEQTLASIPFTYFGIHLKRDLGFDAGRTIQPRSPIRFFNEVLPGILKRRCIDFIWFTLEHDRPNVNIGNGRIDECYCVRLDEICLLPAFIRDGKYGSAHHRQSLSLSTGHIRSLMNAGNLTNRNLDYEADFVID